MAVKQCCCAAKSSPNKKSIFGLRNQILSFIFFACFLADVASGLDTDVSCSNVRSAVEKIGMLPAVDILDQPNSDAGGLCLSSGCCAASARPRLLQLARAQLDSSMRAELTKLADVLASQGRKFDEFFRKLLQQSREDFHAMFKRTYGMIYEQHSYVFEQLFVQLERYYARGDTDLDNIMDRFFGILYQKMFTVLNAQYSFDEKYLKCVGEHMRETQPFDDVPHKLSVQLRRAFVATRTFHKALRAGAEVVRSMQQVGVSPECVSMWARLRGCGACGGAPPACSRYCHNVLRGCLAAHADLAPHWDAYVDAVEKVADRLTGPFNIVMVVEPIDIKISEAIMNFQEHNPEISQKIFTGCGKPVLGGPPVAGPFFTQERTKRSAKSIPDFDWSQKANDVDDFEIETSLETLMKEDPSLISLSSPREIHETARKMARQAEDRGKFLQYMRGDIDAEEYEEHERRRRDAAPAPAPAPAPASSEIDYRSYDFDGKRGKGKGKKPASKADSGRDSNQWGSQSLARLVRETRARVRSSRRYWASLPYVLCSEPRAAAPPAPAARCFNGSHAASYTLAAAGEGSAALASNPEVRGAAGGAGAGAGAGAAQQEQLKALTARLKNAYNGVEVQWRDDDDDQIAAQTFEAAQSAGSGSGSGDGDGDGGGGGGGGGDRAAGLPDDDEDGAGHDYPASGEGPPDEEAPPPAPAPPAPASPPPAFPPAFPPAVVGGGGDARNVHLHASANSPTLHGRYGDEEAPRSPPPPGPAPGREAAPSAGAAPPALTKALLAYALPVVAAWFGAVVADII